MTTSLDSLLHQRSLILQDMQAIDSLRRGSLSQQFFKARPGQPAHGPYFVLQGFFQGKKFSERIPATQAPEVQQQVNNYRKFQQLAEQYVTLSDQIARLGSPNLDSKKNSSPKKPPTSSSGKPKPS
jgi:hypothetical protein